MEAMGWLWAGASLGGAGLACGSVKGGTSGTVACDEHISLYGSFV
jgi:hypothetical protein